jgi:hypothetical protein
MRNLKAEEEATVHGGMESRPQPMVRPTLNNAASYLFGATTSLPQRRRLAMVSPFSWLYYRIISGLFQAAFGDDKTANPIHQCGFRR